MSSDKRLLMFVLLAVPAFLGIQALMIRTGMIKPAVPIRKDVARGEANPGRPQGEGEAGKPPAMVGGLPKDVFMPPGGIMPEGTEAPQARPRDDRPAVAKARMAELVLGAADVNDSSDPYRLRLQLDQDDASVRTATSARYDGEFNQQARNVKPGRLLLMQPNKDAPRAPGSLAIFVGPAGNAVQPVGESDADPATVAKSRVEVPVSDWEVVRDAPDAPAVRAIIRPGKATGAPIRGQELAFRARLADPAAVVTKVFRIWEGQDGFEVDLRFAAADATSKLTYRLVGPHGIPIEGEWYTTSFRDIYFGQVKPGGTEVVTHPAYDAHKYAGDPSRRMVTYPLAYAGVEDQYFATFVEPVPIPKTNDDRYDAAADMFLIHAKAEDTTKADLTVAIDSRPITVGPNLGEVVHSYKVFAGPKTAEALAPYEAQDLTTYRKVQYWFLKIPFAGDLATHVITPLLGRIYRVTESVSRLFGGTKGNYGVAIILLTMTVRLIMFPIGRKQAMMAKKMQDLQPVLNEVKEKYKDDKEAMTRETMAVWREHKINPAAGCLPALIQMPIFVGLWQSLNNSVALRHSSFLYIRDLAAPDMLFKLPVGIDIPYLGPYVNALPFFVVGLMLLQTKLFSPPPTTPEAEQQQKVMKYMMVGMAFMFYKVPSGLGLYFITSSLWQVSERLLLPKIMKTPAAGPKGGSPPPGKGPGGGGPGRGPSGGDRPPVPQGWLGKRLEKILEEAEKNKTHRNGDRPGSGSGSTGRGLPNGDGGRPRSKPPGKRR